MSRAHETRVTRSSRTRRPAPPARHPSAEARSANRRFTLGGRNADQHQVRDRRVAYPTARAAAPRMQTIAVSSLLGSAALALSPGLENADIRVDNVRGER